MKIKQLFTTTNDGNIAFHVTSNHQEVIKNRETIASKYDFNINNMRYMEQTHGDNVYIITKNSPLCISDCDAIITNEANIPLMVMVADCIPILMFDNKKGVIAAIHAGRNSTFLKIVPKTALIMMEKFDCKANDIKAIFGPSIHKCCYEVNEELRNIVRSSFGKEFIVGQNIDLQGINEMLLNKIGINNVERTEICTFCSSKKYFSYRLNKNCGRFAGIIELHK